MSAPRRLAPPRLLAIEHGPVGYWFDYGWFAACAAGLAIVAARLGPLTDALALMAAGVLAWTLIEYAMHRFMFHGVEPFAGWHARHHHRPTALIGTPTLVSSAVLAAGAFAPLLYAGGLAHACAGTAGVVLGYLSYGLVHYATHHGRARLRWLSRRRDRHARHHATGSSHYGVTTGFWDRAFGTVEVRAEHARRPPGARPAPLAHAGALLAAAIAACTSRD